MQVLFSQYTSVTEYSDPPENPGTGPDFTKEWAPTYLKKYFLLKYYSKTDLFMSLDLKNNYILNFEKNTS